MDNRHGQYLLGMFDAVLTDCVRYFPNLAKELKRDSSRLHSSVKSRGLSVLTLDLPLLGKAFDLALHSERLVLPPSSLSGRRWKGSPIPRLFSGLMMRVFDASGMLRNDADIEAIRFLRQLFNLAKKWRNPCADRLVYEEVRKYFRVDELLPIPEDYWNGTASFVDEPDCVNFNTLRLKDDGTQVSFLFEEENPRLPQDTVALSGIVLNTLQRVCDVITSSLGVFELDTAIAKHGPGVVSDLRKGGSKYDFPYWPDRLERIFPMSQFAFANEGQWADFVSSEEGCDPTRFRTGEVASRLIAVPKTQKGPRLIAAEPVAHQWCQQIIRNWMYDRAATTWLKNSIDFHDQVPNQVLAQRASESGEWATIDLSSASDRMTCAVVQRVFRKNPFLLDALSATRTRIIRNPIDKKSGEYHYLRKFSTMGSAVTFPVQSLVFLAVALTASYHHHFGGDPRVSRRKLETLSRGIRVFGDDIIVPECSAKMTLALLQHLFFEVNASKTFTGPSRFRESCGVEAYAGEDVTPAYALTSPRRSAPDSYVSTVAMAHNFYSKKLYAVADYLRRTLTQDSSFKLPWVELGSGIFGWPSPFGFDCSGLTTRYNRKLQRMEYRTRLVIHKVSRSTDRGPSRLLQYFTEAPLPDLPWASGVVVKGRTLTRSV